MDITIPHKKVKAWIVTSKNDPHWIVLDRRIRNSLDTVEPGHVCFSAYNFTNEDVT